MKKHYHHVRFTLSEQTFRVRRNLLLFGLTATLLLLGDLKSPIELDVFGLSVLLQEKLVLGLLFTLIVFQMPHFFFRVLNEFNRHWSDDAEVKEQRVREWGSMRQREWVAEPDLFRNYLKRAGIFDATIPFAYASCVALAILGRLMMES